MNAVHQLRPQQPRLHHQQQLPLHLDLLHQQPLSSQLHQSPQGTVRMREGFVNQDLVFAVVVLAIVNLDIINVEVVAVVIVQEQEI